jgi:hypothetical protein
MRSPRVSLIRAARAALTTAAALALLVLIAQRTRADDEADPLHGLIAKPGLYKSITEPPCSYCSTQDLKKLIRDDDPCIVWLRGAHNGGAVPLRYFLAGPRVVNDTYGLFFYDPDGGYVAAFEKDYGYEFHGWRRGVMVVKDKDGTLWSALSGRAIDGERKGERLRRIPSVVTQWRYWLMLHPESTAYDLFEGKTYDAAAIPQAMSDEAKKSMGEVDARLEPLASVLGVELDGQAVAYPLDEDSARACVTDTVADQPIAVFWYGPTHSAVAYSSRLGDRRLTFFADEISPESAPFKDKETGTRWTIAGRAVDGPLKGSELDWVDSIQCRWYAWAAEYPETAVHGKAK